MSDQVDGAGSTDGAVHRTVSTTSISTTTVTTTIHTAAHGAVAASRKERP